MNNGWKWYGVKTVYRLEPSGSPEAIDSDYWAEGGLVEERHLTDHHECPPARAPPDLAPTRVAQRVHQVRTRGPHGGGQSGRHGPLSLTA